MKKIVLSVVLFFALAINVQAFTLTPSSGAKTNGSTSTISIYANPGAGSTNSTTMIKVSVTNATVTGFTKGSTFDIGPLGTCDGGTTFTTSSLCFDLAKVSGVITDGELIGTFTVTWGSNGTTSVITKLAGSGYYDGDKTTSSVGQAGSYTIGDLPHTPLDINIGSEIQVFGGGLGLLFLGLYLYRNLAKEKTFPLEY